MRRVDAAEGGEELAPFNCKPNGRFVVCINASSTSTSVSLSLIEFEDDVGEAFEVRIDRAIEGEFDIAGIETALLRIVIAYFDVRKIACGRSSPVRTNRRAKCSCNFCRRRS
jgi:hypothetical protein